MKKLMKKRLKGMTLVEVIIALCIFTIMTSAMAMCITSASKAMISDSHFRSKMNTLDPVFQNIDPNAGSAPNYDKTPVNSGLTLTVSGLPGLNCTGHQYDGKTLETEGNDYTYFVYERGK